MPHERQPDPQAGVRPRDVGDLLAEPIETCGRNSGAMPSPESAMLTSASLSPCLDRTSTWRAA
jgi:hypothetical protein